MTLQVSRASVLREVKDYVLITIGVILYAAGYSLFQLPYQIPSGGMAGACALLYYATGFPTSVSYLIVNGLLLLIALKVLGFNFMVRTIYAVLTLTFFMALIQGYAMQDDGHLVQLIGDQKFMACIIGAAAEGIGLCIVFIRGGSTGGTDIIAAIVNKFRDMSLGTIILMVDVLIIGSSFFVLKTPEALIFGFCTMMVETFVLDTAMNSMRQSVQFMIFSQRYEELADEITKTGRGVTVLDSMGWYTKKEGKVLVVLCQRRESPHIFRVIRTVDPHAFVSQAKVMGVFGQGFDKIKGSK